VPLAPARAARRLLDQYLLACPACDRAAAAHVDAGDAGERLLVRFVCADGCRVDDAVVLGRLPVGEVALPA
jgi:hypothetical protein